MLNVFLRAVLAVLFVSTSCVLVNAQILKGSITFDENAFADSAEIIIGSIFAFDGGATSINDALTGSDLSTKLDIGEFDRGEVIETKFLDNLLINDAGPDLAIYEWAAADGFEVAIGLSAGGFTEYVQFEPFSQGFSEDGTVNAALIDLSIEFGLPDGFTTSTIRIREDDFDSAELSGFGAINSVAIPEPSGSILFLLGAVAVVRRHR